ncbi:leucine-rich repeat-containing protein 71-like [Harmonia axyridis]|uniref:leucine-rich repeat-containing protein 71-like n=1 Tax=Harmonia axyridis TaxID=115357 RepID=UPI001E277D6C|nr:leucine-rich repeat-containing protein 71-like [Harmonia axyridis]
MSSSSNTKNKASKDKVSMLKLAKSNQVSNDLQGFKISLNEVIHDYDPKIKVIYQDALLSKTRLPKDDERIHCPVIIVVLESAQKQVMKAILWKHYPLIGEALSTFLSFSEKYLTINSLKFEDTCFEEADTKLLTVFLKANPNVTDLNMNGNKYNKNFKYLITETKLKYLSLKFCSINHENLAEFIEPLKNAYKIPLVHLNLSNNNIGDAGASVLADVLRVNRILISLNVAANNITDEGAKHILRSLRLFSLNQDEISIRRKIYYQYYMHKHQEVAAYSSNTTYEEDDKISLSRSSTFSATRMRSKTRSTKKSRKSSKSVASLSELSTRSFNTPREISSAPAKPTSPVVPQADSADLIATLDFQSAFHPFVKETTPNGYQFFCRGNFVLARLNFSFNHLTTDVLKDIHEILQYQKSTGSIEEGLRSISIYGNNMKSEETEKLEKDLADILLLKIGRTASTVTISSKDIASKKKRASR